MARYKNLLWTDFIARILVMLSHAASDPHRSSGSDLNTQDQREYRRFNNEELAAAGIRESLDNLRS